jgi:hypothetical protein
MVCPEDGSFLAGALPENKNRIIEQITDADYAENIPTYFPTMAEKLKNPQKFAKRLAKRYFQCFHYAEAFYTRDLLLLETIKRLELRGYLPNQVCYIINIQRTFEQAYERPCSLAKAMAIYEADHNLLNYHIKKLVWGNIEPDSFTNTRPNPNNADYHGWFLENTLEILYKELVARGFVNTTYIGTKSDKGFVVTCPTFDLVFPEVLNTENQANKLDLGIGLANTTLTQKLPLNWVRIRINK